MTNEEKIKQLDTMALAKFLRDAEECYLIPKRYSCNEFYCTFCKNNLCCYVEWLKKECIEDYGDMESEDKE